MILLLAFFAGLGGIVVGLAAAVTLTFMTGAAIGLTDYDGELTRAVAVCGGLGGLAGLLFAEWLLLRVRGVYSIGRTLGYATLVLLMLAALAVASVVALYRTRDVVRPNQEPLQLAFEIRLPPGAAPALTITHATLTTDMNTIPATLRETRQDNDRMVIAGTVELRFHTSARFLELRIGQEPGRVFELKLPASPSPTDSFSDWARVDYINEGDSGCCASNNPPAHPRRAGPSDDIDIRYRVIEPAAQR